MTIGNLSDNDIHSLATSFAFRTPPDYTILERVSEKKLLAQLTHKLEFAIHSINKNPKSFAHGNYVSLYGKPIVCFALNKPKTEETSQLVFSIYYRSQKRICLSLQECRLETPMLDVLASLCNEKMQRLATHIFDGIVEQFSIETRAKNRFWNDIIVKLGPNLYQISKNPLSFFHYGKRMFISSLFSENFNAELSNPTCLLALSIRNSGTAVTLNIQFFES